MRRDRKPISVDTVRSGGADVEVFYDFREHKFFFKMPGLDDRDYAETFVELRRRIDQVCEGAKPLDWKPVILVTLHDAYDDRDHSIRTKPVEGASVSFTFRRCELSPRPDHAECVERVRQERERDAHYGRHRSGYDRGPIEREGYIEREHAIDFEAGDPSEYDREAREKTLERPDSYTNNAGVVELPYEEDVWQGLLAMKRSVDDLHARVGELIGRADFRDKLKRFAASGATPLLGDGSSDSGSP